jgi:large conductance mechanosensitive channel
MSGFRKFLLRGNVIDLAVAVVIGAAFSGVITALVKDLLTPLIAAVGGKPDFSKLALTVHKSQFLYGDFINAVLAFVIMAAVIYFVVVMPFSRLTGFIERNKASTTRTCPECLSDIPLQATRCKFCTAPVQPPGPAPAYSRRPYAGR